MKREQVLYALSVSRDDVRAHLAEVQIQAWAYGPGPVRLVMPSWSPGSYLLREYGRHVQGFWAREAGERAEEGLGEALPWRKVERGVWEVEARKAGLLRVGYKLYSHDLSVRCNHVTDERAFLNGPSTFMYVEGRQRLDHVLHVKAPFEAWKIYCALPSKARAELPVGEGRFEAQDYDHLVDCPIEMGDHQEFDFKACGALHRVVLVGRNQAPVERLKVDLPKLVKATKELFGELPYKRYLTLVMHTEEGRGGLEHRDSTALVFPRDHYATEEGYEDFLCLWCHEHFHAWNVKRIRPTVLGPFDYTREAYTRALWAMEGITSYYENPLMVRAGLMTPMRALELFGRRIGTLLQTPGRRLHSLEEASFDAWIKYYRPDESTQNTTVSYYLKGELVACLLDLELRVRTGGERSLDDVMRELWRRYQASGEGFVEEHLQGLIEEVAGGSLQGFFDAYLRGVEEPPWEECFARVGLRFEPADHDPAKPYLGVNQREVGDTLWVESVKAGSAAEQAGVSPGDELVALDGKKLDRRSLPRLLAGIKPGHEVDLHVFRLGVLRCIRVRFGSALVERYALRPDPDASPQTFALARGWLGVERKKKS